MSESAGKAVFLSYAHEDATPAQRIVTALRDAGVEVWFDQSELRGGDAWDKKIKKQIRECALFLPVISAHTDTRAEGYFRLEWLLAVERSRLMADDAAFLVPVVIDATTDAGARVPDKFRDVQWTRLRDGETPPEFAERVKQLLASELARTFQPVSSELTGSKTRTTPKVGRRVTAAAWAVAIAAAVVAAVLIFQRKSGPTSPLNAGRGTRPLTAEKSAAPQFSEARKLAAKADAMFDQNEDVPPTTLDLAEGLCKQAVGLDPQDGEVRAVYARLLTAYVSMGYDRSPARRAAARTQAELAAKLAPTSDYVQVVLANVYRHDENTQAEAERILREVIARQPNHKLAWRTLGHLLRLSRRFEESLPVYQRAADLPGGDPLALFNLAISLGGLGRLDEAGAAFDRAIALNPHGVFLVQKAILAARRGDLPAARAILEKVPGSAQTEPLNVFHAVTVWLWSREPGKALSIWQSVAQDYVETSNFTGPKDYLTGVALWVAGRRDAALNAWGAALRVVEQRLAVQSNSRDLVGWKAVLLWRLGDDASARQALTLFSQMPESDIWITWATGLNHRTLAARLGLGERAELIDRVRQFLQNTWSNGYVRFDPEFDCVRNEPWFQALLAEADAKK
jgi:tetratricopeptide (TPR) repeat protein